MIQKFLPVSVVVGYPVRIEPPISGTGQKDSTDSGKGLVHELNALDAPSINTGPSEEAMSFRILVVLRGVSARDSKGSYSRKRFTVLPITM